MAKIGRNDPCPCGSGKKYKHCCGAPKRNPLENMPKSDLILEDFVLNRLSEDISFLANAMQLIIGPYGYTYCKEHAEELEKEYQKDGLDSYVKEDKVGVYSATKKSTQKSSILEIRPYGGKTPEKQGDIMTLFKAKHICFEGRQVELFHAYLMDNLQKRFDAYLYIPSEKVIDGREFSSFARRGYDFLLGITLYLELQLGVHVYLDVMNPWEFSKEHKKKYITCLGLKEGTTEADNLSTGLLMMLAGYINTVAAIANKYNASDEVALYHSIGAYTEEEYPDRKAIIQPDYFKPYPLEYNYIGYLFNLIAATCFNNGGLYTTALMRFPQCDFLKYLFGLESIIQVFEDKQEKEAVNPTNLLGSDVIDEMKKSSGFEIHTEDHTFDRRDIYHTAVFWFMDELNGMSNHLKPVDLVYQDFAEINEDDFTLKDGMRNINPARKSTRIKAIRKLRMEIYNVLNGKFLSLCDGDYPGDINCDGKVVAKFPILPWLSNGKESTIHSKPFDWQPRAVEDLYSWDVSKRQDFLTLEYRLTTIPVNCIEEYLNPDVFYSWEERNQLLKLTQQQNEELKLVNDSLKRHIQLNQELVRNLSHSSANYLNSERLAQTGIELHRAENDNPSIEQLHFEGLTLMLQSEQELFLSRQLNSLVWRCSADVESLTQQIRSGLSKEDGVSIVAPIEFALKTIMARILFRDEDRRAEFIRNKLGKTDTEITKMQSSFMLDVLAGEKIEGTMLEWWKKNIGILTIVKSAVWNNLKIVKDKAFYDLITEIVIEQMLNSLSHGDVNQDIYLSFGQANEFKGRPRWAYVECRNICGKEYTGGRGVGITTLNETILQLNNNKKGIEIELKGNLFHNRVWLLASLLKTI